MFRILDYFQIVLQISLNIFSSKIKIRKTVALRSFLIFYISNYKFKIRDARNFYVTRESIGSLNNTIQYLEHSKLIAGKPKHK